jgi:cell division protein FtsZ
MQDAGTALMGVGRATGENRAKDAANMAINSPLLDVSIHNAKGVLYVVSGGPDLTMPEIADASRVITENIDKDAKVIFGYNQIEGIKKGELQVTVIATGFPNENIATSKPKNLFSDNGMKVLLDDTPESVTLDRAERRQINNGLPEENLIIKRTDKSDSQKEIQKEDVINIVVDDDEEDNWNAVPAFLRRKK